LVVLVGMFLMGRLLGLVGAMVTVPLLSSGILIVGYLYRKMLGEEPFPMQLEDAKEPGISWRESARAMGARAAGVVHHERSSGLDDDDAPTHEG
jgi:hypothetical protein